MSTYPSEWQLPEHRVIEHFPKKNDYCLCIPLINEGERIITQLERIQKENPAVDIILCDGGSTDGSNDPKMTKRLGVRTVLIKTGPGKISAQLRMGYAYAMSQGYLGIVGMDGNNKDGTDAIPRFIEKLKEGYDFIQGSRWIKGGHEYNTPFIRKLAINLIHAPGMSIVSRFRWTDSTNGFRAMSRKLLLDPRVQPFRDIFVKYELLTYLAGKAARLGFRVCEIPVTRGYPAGKVPTKIHSVRAHLDLIGDIANLGLGKYDPPRQ